MKHIIHINKHVIASNRKHKKNDPPITVKTYKSNDYCQQVDILDENGNVVASLLHRPTKPLKCGARVWIEAKYGVKMNGQCKKKPAIACPIKKA